MLRNVVNVAAKVVVVTAGALFLSALWLNFVDAEALQTGSGGLTRSSTPQPGAMVARSVNAIAPYGLDAVQAD